MALQQVNLRVEAELLDRLRMLARDRGLSLNAIAGMAFEQLLQASGSTVTEERLSALETRVTKLEARSSH